MVSVPWAVSFDTRFLNLPHACEIIVLFTACDDIVPPIACGICILNILCTIFHYILYSIIDALYNNSCLEHTSHMWFHYSSHIWYLCPDTRSCLIWHSRLEHTSHKLRHHSACRTHFNYAYTHMIIAVSYDALFLGHFSENNIAIVLTLNKQSTQRFLSHIF